MSIKKIVDECIKKAIIANKTNKILLILFVLIKFRKAKLAKDIAKNCLMKHSLSMTVNIKNSGRRYGNQYLYLFTMSTILSM